MTSHNPVLGGVPFGQNLPEADGTSFENAFGQSTVVYSGLSQAPTFELSENFFAKFFRSDMPGVVYHFFIPVAVWNVYKGDATF